MIFSWHGHVPSTAENVTDSTCHVLWSLYMTAVVFQLQWLWLVCEHFSVIEIVDASGQNDLQCLPIVITVIFGQLQTPLHYTDLI